MFSVPSASKLSSLWVTFCACLNHNPSLSWSDLPFHPLSSKKKLHLIKSKWSAQPPGHFVEWSGRNCSFFPPCCTVLAEVFGYHWGSAALIPQQGRGLHCTRARAAGAPSNVHRVKMRTRKPDKTSGKATQIQGKAVTNCGQWNTLLQILGLKTRQRLLGLPQRCASRLGWVQGAKPLCDLAITYWIKPKASPSCEQRGPVSSWMGALCISCCCQKPALQPAAVCSSSLLARST